MSSNMRYIGLNDALWWLEMNQNDLTLSHYAGALVRVPKGTLELYKVVCLDSLLHEYRSKYDLYGVCVNITSAYAYILLAGTAYVEIATREAPDAIYVIINDDGTASTVTAEPANDRYLGTVVDSLVTGTTDIVAVSPRQTAPPIRI